MIRAKEAVSTETETKVSALGLLSAALIAAALMLLLAARPAYATTITVTSTADDSAANGNCTLREAITAANTDAAVDQCASGQSSVTDTIVFNISTGVQTISPASALPTITSPVTIDGTTQPGYVNSPLIELDGSGAGNGVNGLTITAGSSTVKGLAIYDFTNHGILLETGDGNTLQGNYIGTDASGTASGKGNDHNGVSVNGPDNNLIGGSASGDENVISGNGVSGVRLESTEGTRVHGNLIGTDKSGTADLGNSSTGVLLNNAFSCTVGGTALGAGNVIAFNGSDFDEDGDGVLDDGAGVVVLSNADNDILSNSIFSNIGLGIDLDDGSGFPLNGLTPNDPGDGDFGANSLQNFPVLTSATRSGGMATIKGKLNSAGGQTFTIQFFSSQTKDPSGYGEGQTFLGEKPVATNANGNVSFTFKSNVPKGHFVTATATSSFDGTSEFSKARKVVRRR
jgi:CSLREA domain-containing protein